MEDPVAQCNTPTYKGKSTDYSLVEQPAQTKHSNSTCAQPGMDDLTFYTHLLVSRVAYIP